MTKTIVAAALILSGLSANAVTVNCQGEGQSLKAEINVGKADLQQENVLLNQTQIPMTIQVQNFPSGTLYKNISVRVITGIHQSSDLNFGFTVSQAFDADGNVLSSLPSGSMKNIFGMNRKQIGSCAVSE